MLFESDGCHGEEPRVNGIQIVPFVFKPADVDSETEHFSDKEQDQDDEDFKVHLLSLPARTTTVFNAHYHLKDTVFEEGSVCSYCEQSDWNTNDGECDCEHFTPVR